MICQRMFLVVIAICFILIMIPRTILAEQKVAVTVAHVDADPVGSMLAYQVKEGIRRSAGLRLSTMNGPKLMLHLVTQDMSLHPGLAAVYGYAITSRHAVGDPEIFLATGVGECGVHDVDRIAEELVAEMDKRADSLRRALSK